MRRFPVVSAAIASVAISVLGCQVGPTLDTPSNCYYKPDAKWVAQGFGVLVTMPQACPVRTKDVAIDTLPWRDYAAKIYDSQNKAVYGQAVYTTFKDASNVVTGVASSQFDGFNIGQPAGQLGASLYGAYKPGHAGFGITGAKVDSAVNYTFTAGANERASVSVALPYLLDMAPYMSGPTTVAFGSSAAYGSVATSMRQLPSFQWYQDGQLISGATTGAYNATFATAGAHDVTVKTTSAIGSVFWSSKSVQVTLPDGCGGGGGGGGQLTSCPPQP